MDAEKVDLLENKVQENGLTSKVDDKVDLNENEAQENGFESDVDDEEDDVDESEEDDEEDDAYVDHAICFDDMAKEVMDRVDKARENEEYTKLPKADWDRHWRTIFDEIRRDVVADERFPVAITTPPVYKMYLRCTDERDGHGCPCGFDREMLPFVKIEVPREQPHGVTKGLLVEKICEAVHGTKDAPGRIGAPHDTMVLDGIDWMIASGNLMYDTVFLYCPGMTSHEIRT